MKQIRLHQIGISIFLTLLFSIYAVGCHLYQWKATPKETIVNLKDKPLNIYLVDAAKPSVRAWIMTAEKMDKKQITGAIRQLSKEEIRGMHKMEGNKADRMRQYHVMLSLKKEYAQTLRDTLTCSIALDQVEKMEIYQYDESGSTIATVVLVIGIIAIVAVLIGLIALATKGSSCPFVYADNPGGRVFEGEIYSGATLPQLERHDWLPMPHLQPTGDTYHVVVANKVKEIQHTNLLELIAVDHPDHTTVLFDKYGRPHTLAGLQAPVTAVALDGRDVRDQIIREDSLRFLGSPDNNAPDAADGLVLQFQRPAGATQAKLMINAKNSMWMDYAHGLMMDEFGDRAAKIRENNLHKSTAELQEWMLQQNIPLSVWLETSQGRWERVDYFNLPGPMALKRDVLLLDLSKVKGDQIRIKLGYGYMFWEMDYVGMDFTPDQPVTVHALAPVSAITQDGADITPALRTDDTSYYHQPNIGDEAVVTFPAPPLQPGLRRSLMLHNKGHYQILREPTNTHPDLRYVKQFQKPNAFPNYARAQMQARIREPQMASAPNQ